MDRIFLIIIEKDEMKKRVVFVFVILGILAFAILAKGDSARVELKPLSGQFWVEDNEIILEGSLTLGDGTVVEGSFVTFSKYLYIMPEEGGEPISVSLTDISKLERKGRRQIYVELKDGTKIDGKWASSEESAKAIFIHSIENNSGYIISLDKRDFSVNKHYNVVRLDIK